MSWTVYKALSLTYRLARANPRTHVSVQLLSIAVVTGHTDQMEDTSWTRRDRGLIIHGRRNGKAALLLTDERHRRMLQHRVSRRASPSSPETRRFLAAFSGEPSWPHHLPEPFDFLGCFRLQNRVLADMQRSIKESHRVLGSMSSVERTHPRAINPYGS
jgi:hypothetical protein